MHYTDTDPEKLRDQLNENWRQLRLFKTALSDRDQVIAELHESIFQRDKMIASLNKKLSLTNRAKPLLYAMLGGFMTAVAKFVVEFFVGHLGR